MIVGMLVIMGRYKRCEFIAMLQNVSFCERLRVDYFIGFITGISVKYGPLPGSNRYMWSPIYGSSNGAVVDWSILEPFEQILIGIEGRNLTGMGLVDYNSGLRHTKCGLLTGESIDVDYQFGYYQNTTNFELRPCPLSYIRLDLISIAAYYIAA